jgi:hypothetical protein
MQNDSASLNIALLPDEKTRLKAIDLSKKLNENLPTNFVLNETDLLPHLTIYQAHYPMKNIEKIEKEVEEMLKAIKPFQMNMNGFWSTPQGNIWWNAQKEPMATLQKNAMERFNSLREGLIIPGIEKLASLGEDYAWEINNYGSMWLTKRYTPHISLTAVEPENIEKTLEFLGDGEPAEFTANEIILGYLGKYGTVTGIIKRYNLS